MANSKLNFKGHDVYMTKEKCFSDIKRVENLIGRIYIVMMKYNQIDILDYYENRVDLLLKIRQSRVSVLRGFYFIHYRDR